MRVYRWGPGLDESAWLQPAGDDYVERMRDGFCGQSMEDDWEPLVVSVISKKKPQDRVAVDDFVALTMTERAVSARAVQAVGDYLRMFGELLPLISPGRSYWAYNVTHLVDALNEDASEVAYFAESNRIMMIDRYEFLPERIADAGVFKLSVDPCGDILLTESAVERLESNGCTGLNVELVWQG